MSIESLIFWSLMEIAIVYILIVALVSMWTNNIFVDIAEILWCLMIAIFVPTGVYITYKEQ